MLTFKVKKTLQLLILPVKAPVEHNYMSDRCCVQFFISSLQILPFLSSHHPLCPPVLSPLMEMCLEHASKATIYVAQWMCTACTENLQDAHVVHIFTFHVIAMDYHCQNAITSSFFPHQTWTMPLFWLPNSNRIWFCTVRLCGLSWQIRKSLRLWNSVFTISIRNMQMPPKWEGEKNWAQQHSPEQVYKFLSPFLPFVVLRQRYFCCWVAAEKSGWFLEALFSYFMMGKSMKGTNMKGTWITHKCPFWMVFRV